MRLQHVWNEISQGPPSSYRTRTLIAAAQAAAVSVDTDRSRRLAPAFAALHFDTAESAAEIAPVASAVRRLADALERGPDSDSEHEPSATLDRARSASLELAAQLNADIETAPQSPASQASRRLAARLVTDLVEVDRLRPTVDSYELYCLGGMALYAVLAPPAETG